MILYSADARAHYDRRRQSGDTHTAASRNLANRYIGMLHFCLQTRQTYDPVKAFARQLALPNHAAC